MTFFPRTVTFWLRYWLFIDGQINRYALYPRRLVPPSLVNQYFGLGFDFHLLSQRRMSVNRNKNRNYVLTHRSSTTDDCWLLPRLRNLQSIGVFAIFGVVGYVDNWGCPHPIPSHPILFNSVRSGQVLRSGEQSVPALLTRLANIWARLKARFGLQSRQAFNIFHDKRRSLRWPISTATANSLLIFPQPLPSRGSACFALGLWLN